MKQKVVCPHDYMSSFDQFNKKKAKQRGFLQHSE